MLMPMASSSRSPMWLTPLGSVLLTPVSLLPLFMMVLPPPSTLSPLLPPPSTQCCQLPPRTLLKLLLLRLNTLLLLKLPRLARRREKLTPPLPTGLPLDTPPPTLPSLLESLTVLDFLTTMDMLDFMDMVCLTWDKFLGERKFRAI